MSKQSSQAAMKVQNAMEVLTTYGWAMMIIGILVATIFALGLLNPQGVVAAQCVMNQAFQCSTPLLAANGMLTFTLMQSRYQYANITGVGCSEDYSNTHVTTFTTQNQVYMPAGTGHNFTVQCYGASSSAFSGSMGAILNATLYVNYADDVGGFPYSATGKVFAKVSYGSP